MHLPLPPSWFHQLIWPPVKTLPRKIFIEFSVGWKGCEKTLLLYLACVGHIKISHLNIFP